jgi:hypothetical protein
LCHANRANAEGGGFSTLSDEGRVLVWNKAGKFVLPRTNFCAFHVVQPQRHLPPVHFDALRCTRMYLDDGDQYIQVFTAAQVKHEITLITIL